VVRCGHARVRCVHGDEILARMSWRGKVYRAACLDCGRSLDQGLPEACFYTKTPHRNKEKP